MGWDISEFHASFIKIYNEEIGERHFVEVDIQCPNNLHKTQNGLSFLTERIKIEKVEKLVANLHKKN